MTLQDRREFEATLVGSDPGTDVALLRIEADDLVALPPGDSDSLEVGDFVVAIGNPFGPGQTVTLGIVSALGRSGLGIIEGYEDFIQTDASINRGNSGGALVDLDVSWSASTPQQLAERGSVGIGFAVPTRMVKAVVEQLLEFGEVRPRRARRGDLERQPGCCGGPGPRRGHGRRRVAGHGRFARRAGGHPTLRRDREH